ncbi:MAG TPA: RNA polymerase sigma factor [Pyrinomonadaceae bacterium]|nr:RNA polymerase sigma factor [Pyrinomonadaceae bacterium]
MRNRTKHKALSSATEFALLATSCSRVPPSHAMVDSSQMLETVFREEYGRIVSTLIRLSGSFDLAEESLQEAFAAAVVHWEQNGPPKNPGAWLTTVAQRKLLDARRREKTKSNKQSELEYEVERLQADTVMETPVEEETYPDDRLRLIFTCCHPSLSQEARVALTLRTLGGLTTSEIARAFLLPEATLAQRLVRAKNKIRDAGIPYQVPSLDVLPQRLESAQAVIYLIFNEGYSSTTGENLVRNDLCNEAIRLGRLLVQLSPSEPENLGLLALMLLHDSRRHARSSREGDLVTLEEQDRSLWNQDEISEGLRLVERALRMGRVGNYQLQAAIAALHAEAKAAAETDWSQIAAIYRVLSRMNSSPIIMLNRAAAVAMSEGPEKGLAMIDELESAGRLENYYLLHAARGDLLRRLRKFDEARLAYTRALELTSNQVEKNFINKRINELRDNDSQGQ